jgi:hypothetical protein
MSRAAPVILEEESRRAFINLLPSAWIHRDEVPDYHIDMEVVIAEKGKVRRLRKNVMQTPQIRV